MKRYLCLFFVIAALCLCPIAAIGADLTKLGIVDLQRCMTESIEGKKVLEGLKKQKDVMQRRLDKKQNDLMEFKKDLEKQSMMLSLDAKEDKMKEFERQRREFKYFYDDLSDEMKKKEIEVRKKILSKLEKVVLNIGRKGDYLIIFERRSSGIMFLDKGLDVTDEVIEAFNQASQ